MIRFEVAGEIVPWARAGTKGTLRFTPSRQQSYMQGIAILAKVAMRGHKLMDGALGLRLDAIYARPKWLAAHETAFKTSRPDFDNIAKIIGDALSGIIWRDDAQIAEATIYKRYGDGPRLKIEVWPLIDPT